jgi:hypothetical protein
MGRSNDDFQSGAGQPVTPPIDENGNFILKKPEDALPVVQRRPIQPKSWDDIVKSGIIPPSYIRETTPGEKTGSSLNFFKDADPTAADYVGQSINRAITDARGRRRNLRSPREDTPEHMKQEWGWSERELQEAATFFHTAPAHARPSIMLNGLRPNLTTTIGNPRELKQRYGVFGNRHGAELSYGFDAAHPDEHGVKRADVYQVNLPVQDLRIDSYGYPYSERTVKPHEFKIVAHAMRTKTGEIITHEGDSDSCRECKG